MDILILSTSSNNTATFIGSLDCLGEHNISVLRYDEKWHRAAIAAIQGDPSIRERINHPDPRQRFHFPRDVVAMDHEMLQNAKLARPDAIVYISAWEGDFVPLNETLGELNQIAPLIHFLCDAADPPWWPQLQEFERRGTFSLTVNIDGSHVWPGGKNWPIHVHDWGIIGWRDKCLTLLTPLDTRYFPTRRHSFEERPYAIGYAGNAGGPFRSALVQRLQGIRGFAFKQRDDNPDSYGGYAEFLQHARISLSVPFTGSGATTHVKGRVLETGYAGGCLMEWVNPATEAWFTPRHEYWPYHSIEEGAELAEWLSFHPRIAGETAAALHHAVTTKHSPKVFWNTVLERFKK